MVQIIQFLHVQGVPFHFLSNVVNSDIFSVVLIPLQFCLPMWRDRVRRWATDLVVMRSSPATDIYVMHC